MNDKTYHTPTGGPDSTYVPKVAHVPQVDLLSKLVGQKSVEQQTLELLQSIDKNLRFLVERAATQDAQCRAPSDGDVTDVIKEIVPTETPFNKRIDPRTREKRK